MTIGILDENFPRNKKLSGILLSIHLTSNRPQQLEWFLDQLESNTGDKACVEVVIKIDVDDTAMNEMLPREVARRPFKIRYISTASPGDFFQLWRSYDELLRITDPAAYFVVGLNDEMSFDRPNWDHALRRYVGLFPDHIFRLRTSDFRHRNYFDFWEAGWANDTSALMTKRWLDIGGGWCPCNGPDTFQQYVAYYFGWLRRFDRARPIREIAIDDIGFRGHGASLTLSGEALRRRRGASIKPWFVLLSHVMQEEAARRAGMLHAHIWVGEQKVESFSIRESGRGKMIEVVDNSGNVRHRVSYRLSRIRIAATNACRKINWAYYAGAGDTWRSKPWDNSIEYLCLRHPTLDKCLAIVRRYRAPLAGPARRAFKRIWRDLCQIYRVAVPSRQVFKRIWRDLRQVYRDSLGPPPFNRRFRYRAVWTVFRAIRRTGEAIHNGSRSTASRKN
jgi:hypothetical protein